MKITKIECRMARADDDVRAVAALIHKTDPYIYPGICADAYDGAWVRFIGDCMRDRGNLFSMENLTVALADGRIVGVACVIPCGIRQKLTEDVAVPDTFDGDFAAVYDGYFLPLIEEAAEFEGHDVTNVCVDESMRGCGVGRALMEYIIGLYGTRVMHIDVIASNSAALRLYESCGFAEKREYMGFSGGSAPLLCCHLIRKADGEVRK